MRFQITKKKMIYIYIYILTFFGFSVFLKYCANQYKWLLVKVDINISFLTALCHKKSYQCPIKLNSGLVHITSLLRIFLTYLELVKISGLFETIQSNLLIPRQSYYPAYHFVQFTTTAYFLHIQHIPINNKTISYICFLSFSSPLC